MPIPDDTEREQPQVDIRLLEFVKERREQEARQRRNRLLVGAGVALALVATLIAVSNMAFVKRMAGSAAAPAATEPPPVASTPALPAEPAPSASSTRYAPSAPAAPVPSSAPAAPYAPPTPAPAAPAVASTAPAEPPPAASAPPRSSLPAPATTGDSAQRTARWLVETHGRLEAENRAAKVAEFYSGTERAFWRRVLLNVRREPDR